MERGAGRSEPEQELRCALPMLVCGVLLRGVWCVLRVACCPRPLPLFSAGFGWHRRFAHDFRSFTSCSKFLGSCICTASPARGRSFGLPGVLAGRYSSPAHGRKYCLPAALEGSLFLGKRGEPVPRKGVRTASDCHRRQRTFFSVKRNVDNLLPWKRMTKSCSGQEWPCHVRLRNSRFFCFSRSGDVAGRAATQE